MLTRWGLGYLTLFLGVLALVGIALTCEPTPAKCSSGCKASRCYDYGGSHTCGRNCYCYQMPNSTEGFCVEDY